MEVNSGDSVYIVLREFYRDLRKVVVYLFGILLHFPIKIHRGIKSWWALRQHRRNKETANISDIWVNAKPGILRKLKNDERFHYYEFDGFGPKTTINMLAHINKAIENAEISVGDDPTGKFIIELKVSQFYVRSELYDVFRKIVISEISCTFGKYFELDLNVLNTEDFVRSVEYPHKAKVTFL